MPGGLLNLVAYGNLNVIINGNPTKTFFKTKYAKYTNFGLQKFRLDFEGLRTLRLTEDSTFIFKVPRYADLLMDTYLVIDLPNIWSPICASQKTINVDGVTYSNVPWRPYEFKWIENIGAQLIRNIKFTVGGQTIQTFSGQYLYNMVQRDFSAEKKKLFLEMIGHVPELVDPKVYNNGCYPNAWFIPETEGGPQPSIPSRRLYIPLNIWFTLASKMAFPLVSLQYNILQIEIECRPIQELFVIRDVLDPNVLSKQLDPHQAPYIRADQNIPAYQFFRFIQPPPNEVIFTTTSEQFPSKRTDWFADIHLNSTYAFLGDDEVKLFAANPQSYLIKEVHETKFYNVTGNQRIQLYSLGLVANWMWFFQRDDINLRNEWSNYTNWPYNNVIPFPPTRNFIRTVQTTPNETNDRYSAFIGPSNGVLNYNNIELKQVINTTTDDTMNKWIALFSSSFLPPFPGAAPSYQIQQTPDLLYGPATQPNGLYTGSNICITGKFRPENQQNIMLQWGLLLDGKYRETPFSAGVFEYIEKYIRTAGNAPDIYCYNFNLTTDPFDFQPSGALNLSKFSIVEFEFSTHVPPLDPSAQTFTICDPSSGIPIAVNKPVWRIYDYNYDLYLMEERYNILMFESGNAGLMFSR